MDKIKRRIILTLFIVYCAVLAFVLLYPPIHYVGTRGRSASLVPFATIGGMLGRLKAHTINTDAVLRNIGMNILLFVPMGLALPALFPKMRKLPKAALACFAAPLFAETMQYVFNLGSFDVDDIILNTLGGLIGHAVMQIPVFKKAFEV